MSTPETTTALDKVLAGARAYTSYTEGDSIRTDTIQGTKEAVAFLSRLAFIPKYEMLRLLAIPMTKDAFFGIHEELLEKTQFEGEELHRGTTNMSSAGAQLFRKVDKHVTHEGSYYTHDIIIETPSQNGPFMHLTIERGWYNGPHREGHPHPLLLLFAYDTELFNPEKFWSSNHAAQESCDGLHTVSLFIAWLAERYLEYVRDEMESIESQFDIVAVSFTSIQTTMLSKMMLRLNKCSHDLRALDAGETTTFALEFAIWAGELMRDPGITRRLGSVSKQQELRSKQLRDKIDQTRAEITDLAAQQRQEQEEIQRARAYRLQELSLGIAEDSRRDSRTMRGIAWVTMAFLPATFVTSFFGMNFFDGIADQRVFDETSRNVWVFFVIALPISAMVLVVFWWWDRKTQVLERVEREAREKALAS